MFLICNQLGKKLLRDALPLKFSAEMGRNCGQAQHRQVCTYKAWACFCWHRVDHSFGSPKPPSLIGMALLGVCGWFLTLLWQPLTTEVMHFFPTGPSSPVAGFWARAVTCPRSPKVPTLAVCVLWVDVWKAAQCQQPSSRDWCLTLGQHCFVVMSRASPLHWFNPEHPDQVLSRDPRRLFHHSGHAKILSSLPLFAQNMSNRYPAGWLILTSTGGSEIAEAKEQLFSHPSLGWCITMLGPAENVGTSSLCQLPREVETHQSSCWSSIYLGWMCNDHPWDRWG